VPNYFELLKGCSPVLFSSWSYNLSSIQSSLDRPVRADDSIHVTAVVHTRCHGDVRVLGNAVLSNVNARNVLSCPITNYCKVGAVAFEMRLDIRGYVDTIQGEE
jgi:hypothetical protein